MGADVGWGRRCRPRSRFVFGRPEADGGTCFTPVFVGAPITSTDRDRGAQDLHVRLQNVVTEFGAPEFESGPRLLGASQGARPAAQGGLPEAFYPGGRRRPSCDPPVIPSRARLAGSTPPHRRQDEALPPREVDDGRVGRRGAPCLARQQDVAGNHTRGKAVGDRFAAEVHQHEAGRVGKRAGVAEYGRVVRIDVAPGAVDQGRHPLPQRDQPTVEGQDGVRVGLLRGGIEVAGVGVDREPGRTGVKPACGPAVHCIGVRALSRPVRRRLSSSTSADTVPPSTRSRHSRFAATSSNCSMEVNG